MDGAPVKQTAANPQAYSKQPICTRQVASLQKKRKHGASGDALIEAGQRNPQRA
jgi:hypothetical protein